MALPVEPSNVIFVWINEAFILHLLITSTNTSTVNVCYYITCNSILHNYTVSPYLTSQKSGFLLFLCPIWKRGHIVLHLLIGRSVVYLLTSLLESCQTWWSICSFQVTWFNAKVKRLVFVQMLSAQFLPTPLLESCQTWYSGRS